MSVPTVTTALCGIPSGISNGCKAIGAKPAILANCGPEPHDPNEMERLDPFDGSVPYDWALRHR